MNLMVSLVVVLLLGSCNVADKDLEILLTIEDVEFCQVFEVAEHDALSIEVSGLAFHSSLGIRRIVEQRSGSTVRLMIFLEKWRPGLEQTFRCSVRIDDSIDAICVGESGPPVWTRLARNSGERELDESKTRITLVEARSLEWPKLDIVTVKASGTESGVRISRIVASRSGRVVRLRVFVSPDAKEISDWSNEFYIPSDVAVLYQGDGASVVWQRDRQGR